MIEPSPALFYNIVTETFGSKGAFATRAVRKVVMVPPNNKLCPTLCMDRRGVIRVNEGFWRKRVKNKRDARYVMIHELFHAVLGDCAVMKTAMSKYESELMNLSMDMRINAAIHNWFQPKGHFKLAPIFERMYPGAGPGGLLRANSKYGVKSKYRLIYNALYSMAAGHYHGDDELERAKEVFKNEETIRSALKILLPQGPVNEQKLGKLVYVGNHNPDDDSIDDWGKDNTQNQTEEDRTDDADDPEERELTDAPPIIDQPPGIDDDLKDEIREAMLDKLGAMGGAGAGRSNFLFDNIVEVIESSKTVNMHALQQFACQAKINKIKVMFDKPRKVSSVVPINPSANELVMAAAGWTPVFWKGRRTFKGKLNKNIAVYLDVSGSVSSYLSKILGVIVGLRQGIRQVFCFSNEVHEHSMGQLMDGEYKSTGGTDFDCIVNHAIENDIDKLIVFTDGDAWIKEDTKQKCRDQIQDLAIIYFGYCRKDNFFHNTYGKAFELEELLT